MHDCKIGYIHETIFDVTAKVSKNEGKHLVSLLYIRNTQWQTADVHEVSSEKIFMHVKEKFVQCNSPFLKR